MYNILKFMLVMSPFLTQLLFTKTPCMKTHCSDVFLAHGILFQEVSHDVVGGHILQTFASR